MKVRAEGAALGCLTLFLSLQPSSADFILGFPALMPYLSTAHLEKIRWLLTDCGRQARQLALETFEVYEKGVEDYVTDVDRALDQQLFQGLTTLFPGERVISEENPGSRQLFAQGDGESRLWLIDPIDGTDDFINGLPHYSVMLGLLEGGQPQAGWVYAPMFERLYFGGPELGLFLADGDRPPTSLIPMQPLLSADHCPILIGTKDVKRFGASILSLIPEAQFSCIGSFGLKVLEVIQGHAGLYVYGNRRVKLWDTVGPLALAQMAGLVCCDLEGTPLRFTADAVDTETLAHYQTIVVGWPHYVEALRSRLRQAIVERR